MRYNSSQTKTWISEFLERCEIPEAGEILSRLDRLDYEGINGTSLYYWDVKKFQQFFGHCGDIMHRDFHFWVESKFKHVKGVLKTIFKQKSLLTKKYNNQVKRLTVCQVNAQYFLFGALSVQRDSASLSL